MSKIIVTGGAGFIGSHITDRLVKDGHSVVILDNLSSGKKNQINKKAKFINADIKNLNEIKKYFKGAEYVFHLAAQSRLQPSIIDPAVTFHDNINGTLNVLIAARDMGVRRVIFSASSSVYGDQKTFPLKEDALIQGYKTPYGLTKHMGEHMCRLFSGLYGLETVSLRYFNVYGPRQVTEGAYATVIGIFLRQLENNEPITIVSPGTIRRDFTHVSDIVNANICAMKSKKVGKGEVVNIGTGRNYSINEVASLILSKVKPQGKKVYIPKRLGEAKISLADNKKAWQLLGWKPKVSFDEGISMLTK